MGAWLVTGGAGFIGCNFVRRAIASGVERVVVLDKLTYAGNLRNLEDVSRDGRFAFVRGDIADRDLISRLFGEHRPSVVVNFAAESHVDRSIDGPRPFIETNVVGTFELLEASRRMHESLGEAERRAFRFLHVSTDEVYGSLGESGSFSETTPYAPNSPYAASKASADHMVRAYHATYDLPAIVTNCSNNYGPFQFPEKLIPLVILNAVEGRPIPVYGDGLQVRDWLHVDDHCDGILAVLERGRPGERYNIGGGNERENIAMVGRICDVLQEARPAAAPYRELIRHVEDRRGHDRRYAIDASKIRAELGWEPRIEVDEGLERTVRWYLEHRAWCEAVEADARYGRERLGTGERGGSTR